MDPRSSGAAGGPWSPTSSTPTGRHAKADPGLTRRPGTPQRCGARPLWSGLVFLFVTGPLDVEGAVAIDAPVGVGAEVVAQALEERGRQSVPAQAVEVCQRGGEGRRGNAGQCRLRHDAPPGVDP